MRRIPLVLLLVAAACSTSSRPPAPATAAPGPATATTPVPLSRIDPNVVEETDTYVITRLPKSDYIRVDDRHVKHPVIGFAIEFFKEDENYYYVIKNKVLPEEEALRRQAAAQSGAPAPTPRAGRQTDSAVPASDFTNLTPPRTAAPFDLVEVAATGLPESGMWRASFAIADMNGDGIPDIVSPPSRLGDGRLHIWLGDGKGAFRPWPLTLTEDGKPAERFSIDYGGVAVGDIDGDGFLDVVCASHTGGLVSLFGDGKGGFRIVRKGLPARDFSTQAVVLLDADGDGKLDMVASRDFVEQQQGQTVDRTQVRLYLYRGAEGWSLKSDAIVGGFYSNSLTAWDYDGDGRKDVLTGSHYVGALTLLWRNEGHGAFSPVSFDAIEIYAFHFATAPGTFGRTRVPAFADSFVMNANVPEQLKAKGITVYSFADGKWERHRVFRQRDPKTSIFGLAMGDLDGDGLDDIVFADNDARRVRVLLQRSDGSFNEMDEAAEPRLDSPGQCVRLVDVDGDGRLDVVVSKTVSSDDPRDKGGWNVYRNRAK